MRTQENWVHDAKDSGAFVQVVTIIVLLNVKLAQIHPSYDLFRLA